MPGVAQGLEFEIGVGDFFNAVITEKLFSWKAWAIGYSLSRVRSTTNEI